MAEHFRWFGHSRSQANPTTPPAPKNDGPRALTTLDELRRRAAWPALAESERAALLAPYTNLPVPPMADIVAAERAAAAVQAQDLTARLVEKRFQPEVASIVSAWLRD